MTSVFIELDYRDGMYVDADESRMAGCRVSIICHEWSESHRSYDTFISARGQALQRPKVLQNADGGMLTADG